MSLRIHHIVLHGLGGYSARKDVVDGEEKVDFTFRQEDITQDGLVVSYASLHREDGVELARMSGFPGWPITVLSPQDKITISLCDPWFIIQ